MEYLIGYSILLSLMFIFQVYRVLSTLYYVYKNYPYSRLEVFLKIIPNEMFTFNRLSLLLSVITFPLVVFWWFVSIAVLCLYLVGVCILLVVTLFSPIIVWACEQVVTPICLFVMKVFTKDYWLSRW